MSLRTSKRYNNLEILLSGIFMSKQLKTHSISVILMGSDNKITSNIKAAIWPELSLENFSVLEQNQAFLICHLQHALTQDSATFLYLAKGIRLQSHLITYEDSLVA